MVPNRAARRRLVRLARKMFRKVNFYKLPNGVCSAYLKISEHWGLKVEKSNGYQYMLTTYKAQMKAAKAGIGPMCFGLNFFYNETTGDHHCGYIVQNVQIFTDIAKDDKQKFGYTMEELKCERLCKQALRALKIARKLFGESAVRDCHLGNGGLLNNKVVIIDFGDEGGAEY